ncbi:MAG: hypothetical protein K2X48_17760 [Chitinophagaceae bacterium]|nr:hypothetical protein [Chitinophagaceae bacterium]
MHILIFFIFTQQRLAGHTEILHFGNTCPEDGLMLQVTQRKTTSLQPGANTRMFIIFYLEDPALKKEERQTGK